MSDTDLTDEIARKGKTTEQFALFDMGPDWSDHWKGMPEFVMHDATPQRQITINFMTDDDVVDFAKMTGLKVKPQSNSAWFPEQTRIRGEYSWAGPKTDSKYPVCIPSKGRADVQTTGKVLDQMGVKYKFFVESEEYENYCTHLGEDKVVSMPFNNLGQGSVPARNFIWDWAAEQGYKRHWTLDDNIRNFVRLNHNRRIAVTGGGFFNAMEDFVDRYSNVVMAGPHNRGFVTDRSDRLAPYLFNSRVYSCILLDTTLPDRWRGRYNEDTDLSLRFLKQGKCTLLFRALLMDKATTVGAKNAKPMKGGNTDNVYNTDDHRMGFAKSLQEQHPDCVDVVWKFNRWHHSVDYSAFKDNKPSLRDDYTPRDDINNYNMTLKKQNNTSNE